MLQKYEELKGKELVKILNTGSNYAISYKQFDPDTGEQIEDKVLSLDVDALKEEKESLSIESQKRIDEIDMILKDIKTTPITPPEPISEELPK